MDQLPRLGKRELICLLLFTCNYVVSVWRGFLFLWVLGMDYVILLWHSLSLPYNYFEGTVNQNSSKLQLNKANASDTEASFWIYIYLFLTILFHPKFMISAMILL